MKTEVIMKRELFGMEISQKSKSEMLSATDLVRAGNRWRVMNGLPMFNIKSYWALKSTDEFVSELSAKYDIVKISGSGNKSHTWVHPFLFIDIALSISPVLRVEVYGWLYDSLLKYRNDSGDSYKRMVGSVMVNINNKSEFQNTIVHIANETKKACSCEDWNSATEKQLEKRDAINNSISLLCDIVDDVHEATRLAIVGINKRYEGESK